MSEAQVSCFGPIRRPSPTASLPATVSVTGVVKEGFLVKQVRKHTRSSSLTLSSCPCPSITPTDTGLFQGNIVKNWKRRYFVLTPSELRYYEANGEHSLRGTIALSDVDSVIRHEKPNSFRLITQHGMCVLTGEFKLTLHRAGVSFCRGHSGGMQRMDCCNFESTYATRPPCSIVPASRFVAWPKATLSLNFLKKYCEIRGELTPWYNAVL